MAKRTMTPEHKAAIASGRAEGAAVKRYLETINEQSKPGRRVSKGELEERLAKGPRQVSARDVVLWCGCCT